MINKVVKFLKSFPSQNFHVDMRFDVELDNDIKKSCSIDEEFLWKFICTEKVIYEKLGLEICLLLDFAFAMGGSEAIVESYYSVMQS